MRQRISVLCLMHYHAPCRYNFVFCSSPASSQVIRSCFQKLHHNKTAAPISLTTLSTKEDFSGHPPPQRLRLLGSGSTIDDGPSLSPYDSEKAAHSARLTVDTSAERPLADLPSCNGAPPGIFFDPDHDAALEQVRRGRHPETDSLKNDDQIPAAPFGQLDGADVSRTEVIVWRVRKREQTSGGFGGGSQKPIVRGSRVRKWRKMLRRWSTLIGSKPTRLTGSREGEQAPSSALAVPHNKRSVEEAGGDRSIRLRNDSKSDAARASCLISDWGGEDLIVHPPYLHTGSASIRAGRLGGDGGWQKEGDRGCPAVEVNGVPMGSSWQKVPGLEGSIRDGRMGKMAEVGRMGGGGVVSGGDSNCSTMIQFEGTTLQLMEAAEQQAGRGGHGFDQSPATIRGWGIAGKVGRWGDGRGAVEGADGTAGSLTAVRQLGSERGVAGLGSDAGWPGWIGRGGAFIQPGDGRAPVSSADSQPGAELASRMTGGAAAYGCRQLAEEMTRGYGTHGAKSGTLSYEGTEAVGDGGMGVGSIHDLHPHRNGERGQEVGRDKRKGKERGSDVDKGVGKRWRDGEVGEGAPEENDRGAVWMEDSPVF